MIGEKSLYHCRLLSVGASRQKHPMPNFQNARSNLIVTKLRISCQSLRSSLMSANQQPSGPSQATRVLFHVLWSLLASALMAGVTAGANYLYTGGSSINITVVGSAA